MDPRSEWHFSSAAPWVDAASYAAAAAADAEGSQPGCKGSASKVAEVKAWDALAVEVESPRESRKRGSHARSWKRSGWSEADRRNQYSDGAET